LEVRYPAPKEYEWGKKAHSIDDGPSHFLKMLFPVRLNVHITSGVGQLAKIAISLIIRFPTNSFDLKRIDSERNVSANACLQQCVARRVQDEQKIALLRLGRLAQPGDD